MDALPARCRAIVPDLAARVAALPTRRQEQVQDAGLGAALAVVNVVSLLPYLGKLHPAWLAVTLVAAQAIPLAWRRSRPVGVGIVIGAARIAYDQLGFGLAPFPLGPAIAVYTIIDRRGPAWRRITCLLVAAGIATSETAPGHSQPYYDSIFQAVIFLTAWAAGVLSRTKRASLRAAQERADRAEASADQQAALAAAAERTRIARELHDVVAHHVSLMAVQAEAAASLLPGKPEQARRCVDVIGDTARQALTELRRLLGVLRGPADLPQTVPSASLADLDVVLDQVRGAGLAVQLDVVGTPEALAPSIDLTAYRIVQEALTNTLRHAQASRAVVTLCYEPGHVTVRVAEQGSGKGRGATERYFPGGTTPQNPPLGRGGDRRTELLRGSGLGIAGIAERVTSCGGSLTVGPTQAEGFAVSARLPVR